MSGYDGRPKPRLLEGERGFTLIEVLMAIALLTIGIVGVGAALTLQTGGLSGGATSGLAAITRANYLSTATMLAQERVEQIKNAQWTVDPSVDDVTGGACTSGPTCKFPNEDYGAITSYPNFRRDVTIVDGPDADTKTITVKVSFRPPTESGLGQEESVKLVTIIARRPNTKA